MIKCDKCGTKNFSDAKSCKKCGSDLPDDDNSGNDKEHLEIEGNTGTSICESREEISEKVEEHFEKGVRELERGSYKKAIMNSELSISASNISFWVISVEISLMSRV